MASHCNFVLGIFRRAAQEQAPKLGQSVMGQLKDRGSLGRQVTCGESWRSVQRAVDVTASEESKSSTRPAPTRSPPGRCLSVPLHMSKKTIPRGERLCSTEHSPMCGRRLRDACSLILSYTMFDIGIPALMHVEMRVHGEDFLHL